MKPSQLFPGPTDRRFAVKVLRTGDCLVWQGYIMPNGYGRFRYNGRIGYAHRYAWERERGPIPAHLEIDHECENPACVNIDHLRLVPRTVNLKARRHVRKRRPRIFREKEKKR